MELYNCISQEKCNMRIAKEICAALSEPLRVLELVAHLMGHSPHLRCSPVLEGYQLEECQILCHQSVQQKEQTEFRLPAPPPKLFSN